MRAFTDTDLFDRAGYGYPEVAAEGTVGAEGSVRGTLEAAVVAARGARREAVDSDVGDPTGGRVDPDDFLESAGLPGGNLVADA